MKLSSVFIKLLTILYLHATSLFIHNTKKNKLLGIFNQSFFSESPNLSGYDMRYPLKEDRNFTKINNIYINIQKKLLLSKLCDPDMSILTKIDIIRQAEADGLLDFNKKKDFESW